MKLVEELKNIYSSISSQNLVEDMKKCGIDNFNEFILELINNAEPIEYLLEYHNRLGDVTISSEERNIILNKYYDMLMMPENMDKMKNFIVLLKKLDKDVISCMVKKLDCSQIDMVYKKLIGERVEQMVMIMKNYRDNLKEFMKWMALSGYEITSQCGIEMKDIRSLYKDVCNISCNIPRNEKQDVKLNKSNNCLILLIILIILLVVIFLKFFKSY